MLKMACLLNPDFYLCFFLLLFLWRVHRAGVSAANSFLVIMSERLQSTGPFACTEQCKCLSELQPSVQGVITGSTDCEKRMHKGLGDNKESRLWTKDIQTPVFRLPVLFFQRIRRWYNENYKSIKYTFIKDLLTLKKVIIQFHYLSEGLY